MRWFLKLTVTAAAAALCCVGVTGAADSAQLPGPNPSTGIADISGSPWTTVDDTEYWDEAEDEVVRLVNEARAVAGCDALTVDERLTAAAREHSAQQADPEPSGPFSPPGRSSASDLAEDAGYAQPASEFIATGHDTADEAVRMWLDLRGARAALLECDTDETGVGVVIADGGPYWTQVLGRSS